MWKKLLWKVLLNGIVTVPLLMWFGDGVSLGMAVVTSLCLTVVAYIIGDQMILRSSNNVIATVSDALLAFFILWLVAYYAGWTLSFTELCAISIVLAVVEYFYHPYLLRQTEQRA
jgi:hypothetical protein